MHGGIKMRKYLYAFISCCVVQSVFAEPSGVYQNQHVSSILIPRIILQNVLIQDDLISQTPGAVEKMMAKYDKLAGPLGQEPLTVNDITQICVESGVITQKEDCLNRVFNPVLAEMGKVRFMNTCSGKITGGSNHCIDDVFVEGKKQNGNQYHQDVNVNPYAANGFAIEYAKKKGHDVWCSSEIKDATINCTTLDNKEFYSVKFKGTGNTTDSTIEKNLVKGICALFDSKYAMGTFRHQCKMNCGAGTEARNVIQKFGLTVHDGYSTDTHCEIYQPTYTAKDVKTYPGYEYMSRAFNSVQSVLDSSLVNVLETYVKLQGINVQSFNCEYSSRKYSDEMPSGSLQGAPVSLDDMLRCRINDIEVDFVFDDLFEGKEYERKAGQAAMQCILAGGDYGSDRICSGLTKQKCLSPEVQSMVPGGTRWDSKAEVCLLNRAEKARDISNALQVVSGIALAIVFTPTGMPFVALAAVGGSVALDMAFIGVERLNILEPASRARAFATDAQKCQIPIDSKYPSCSKEQVDCAWRVVNQHFARLDEILDRLNPDQLSLISDLMENTTDCLSKELLSSAVNMSTPNAWDKALHKANAFLLVAGIFIQPEKGVMKITENAPKIARILSRCKMVERASAQLDNTRYIRIFVDNLSGPEDMMFLATEFRKNGAYVSSRAGDLSPKLYKAEDGTHFMAVAEKDISSQLDKVFDFEHFLADESVAVAYLREWGFDYLENDLRLLEVMESQGHLNDVSRLSDKARQLLLENGNDISKTRRQLSLALEEYDNTIVAEFLQSGHFDAFTIEKDLRLIDLMEEAKRAGNQAEVARLYSELSDETRQLYRQHQGGLFSRTKQQMKMALENFDSDAVVAYFRDAETIRKELSILEEMENAERFGNNAVLRQSYATLLPETKQLLNQNGNDISRTIRQFNSALKRF
jgi:hypothetical protein